MSHLQRYDVDSTAGELMEKIHTLADPPQSEESVRRDKAPKATECEVWSKRCRHETCNVCGKEGELLSCDRCLAAFHLQCCNPPLQGDEVFSGEWACHRCVITGDLKSKEDGHHQQTLTAAAIACLKEYLTQKPDDDVAHAGETVSSERVATMLPSPQVRTAKASDCTDSDIVPKQNLSGGKDKDWRKSDMKLVTTGRQTAIQEANEVSQARTNSESSFAMLIKAACLQDTSLLDLPSELAPNTPVAGLGESKKQSDKAGGKQRNPGINGLVSTRARKCFTCGRSNRREHLVSCDFCRQLFHLDCLDPPLTNLPTTKWMCPNHSETALLCNPSQSTPTKIKVLDKFSARLNQHKVKLDFLRNSHRPFSLQNVMVQREFKKSRVPQSVKDHYKQPSAIPPLPPKKHLDSFALPPKRLTVFSEQSSTPIQQGSVHQFNDALAAEQEVWLKSVIGLQSEAALLFEKSTIETAASETATEGQSSTKFINPNSTPVASNSHCGLFNLKTLTETCENSSNSHQENNETIPDKDTNAGMHLACNEAPNTIQERSAKSAVRTLKRRNSDPGCHTPAKTLKVSTSQSAHSFDDQGHVGCNGSAETQAAAMKCGTRNNDVCQDKIDVENEVVMNGIGDYDSNGMTKEIRLENDCISPSLATKQLAPLPVVSTEVKSPIAGAVPDPVEFLDDRLIRVLALQRLQQFDTSIAKNSANGDKSKEMNDDMLNELLRKATSEELKEESHSVVKQEEVEGWVSTTKDDLVAQSCDMSPTNLKSAAPRYAVRAALSAVASKAEEIHRVPFRRSCTVGTSTQCDVVLRNQNNCKHVSPIHARIFYDEIGEHFELLNSSRFGTSINGCVYGIDMSGPSNKLNNKYHKPYTQPMLATPRAVKLVKAIKSTVSHKSTRKDRKATKEEPTCRCETNKSSARCGWEGGAILYHGSTICFGCNEFVFCLPEYSSSQNITNQRPSIIHKLWERVSPFANDKYHSKSKLKSSVASPLKRTYGNAGRAKVINSMQITSKGNKKFQKVNHSQSELTNDAHGRSQKKVLPAQSRKLSKSVCLKHKPQSRKKHATISSGKPSSGLDEEERIEENFLDCDELLLDDNNSDESLSELANAPNSSVKYLEKMNGNKNCKSENDSSLPPTSCCEMESKLNVPCVKSTALLLGGKLMFEASEVSPGEVAVSDPDSESPGEEEDLSTFATSFASSGGNPNRTAARKRKRSLMELMCTETLDDFKSPSKDALARQSLPVLIQDITRVHQERKPLPLQPRRGTEPTSSHPTPSPDYPSPHASTLLQFADVVMKQA